MLEYTIEKINLSNEVQSGPTDDKLLSPLSMKFCACVNANKAAY